MNSKFLYLNTSSTSASIGLWDENGRLIKENFEAGRELSALLSKKVNDFLRVQKVKKEELAGVVVCPGPGSFTGLRIGIAFANAFAFSLGIPVFKEEEGGFNKQNPQTKITPFYGAEPNITKPRRVK